MAAVEKRQPTPTETLLDRIGSTEFMHELELAMPPGVSVDRFVRVTKTAIIQNPELVTCDRASLFTAIARCAQDGLLPDGRQAAFVIFKGRDGKKAQYLPMIGGLRDIASAHGFSLEAYVVYENDDFTWQLGFSPSVSHYPPKLSQQRGEAIGAYAVATQLATGQKFLEVMSRDEIEQVRDVSRAKDNGPWVNWWGEMARKTVARRLFKQLPLGDLDDREQHIVKHVDADIDLPPIGHGAGMTAAEADIAASLTTTPPRDDDKPADVKNGTEPASPAQHADLLNLVVELTNADDTVDWQAQAVELAQGQFEKTLVELTTTEIAAVLDHLEAQLIERQTS